MSSGDVELIALYNQEGHDKRDLSFKKGDKIAFLRRRGEWVEGILNGKRGWLPLKFVKIVDKKTGQAIYKSSLPQAPTTMNLITTANLSREEVENVMSKFLLERPDDREEMKQMLRDKNLLIDKKKKKQKEELDVFFSRRPTLSDRDLANFIADLKQSEKESKLKPNKRRQGADKKKKIEPFPPKKKGFSPRAHHTKNGKRPSICGMTLQEILEFDGVVTDVPVVIKLCIDFIKIHGLDVHGIFRVPGHQATVDSLSELFYVSEMAVVGGITPFTDIHVVAELLKKVLRDLPDPLFTNRLYNDFVKCLDLNEAQRITKYRELFCQLPKVNQDVIKYLFPLLIEVSKHSLKNQMDAENIATIFGPTLLKCNGEDLFSSLSDKGALVVKDFMESFEAVCGEKHKESSPKKMKKSNSNSPASPDETPTKTRRHTDAKPEEALPLQSPRLKKSFETKATGESSVVTQVPNSATVPSDVMLSNLVSPRSVSANDLLKSSIVTEQPQMVGSTSYPFTNRSESPKKSRHRSDFQKKAGKKPRKDHSRNTST